MEVTQLLGARTNSSNNLIIQRGNGLGGKALEVGRPVSVSSYLNASGITHVYDHAVRPECLETVAALPLMVDGVPRVLIFLAARTQVGLGDRWFDSFGPVLKDMRREIEISDEVARRLGDLKSAQQTESATALSRGDLIDIARELTELALRIEDDEVRSRVEAVSKRVAPAAGRAMSHEVAMVLRDRELEVVRLVAQGMSNREIAEALNLQQNTIKSYLKTAMRKLHASNRVQAIVEAKRLGLIRV
ncbi:response regulator transcription factor [Nocardioides sp.]|uniref:response regulator transcription factor n=1 Tax=Nocardioides sp. TaxID=35761 RepID=UPI0035AF9FCE